MLTTGTWLRANMADGRKKRENFRKSESFGKLFYIRAYCNPLFAPSGRACPIMQTLQWIKCFVTMATYWVQDFPNRQRHFLHLWRSIFIFANHVPHLHDSGSIQKIRSEWVRRCMSHQSNWIYYKQPIRFLILLRIRVIDILIC